MISEKLKEVVKRRGLTYKEAAKRCELGFGTFYSYVSGTRSPGTDALKKLSRGLVIPLDDLLKDYPTASIPSTIQPSGKEVIVKVPVVGEIHAGQPMVADENINRYTYIYADKSLEGRLFGLEVKGDSMSPDIAEGETCIVKKELSAEDGNIVVALVNQDEVVIRKFFHLNGNIILQATNQAYPPILIKENEQFRIVGVVMFCQRRFK